jgi:cytochrome c
MKTAGIVVCCLLLIAMFPLSALPQDDTVKAQEAKKLVERAVSIFENKGEVHALKVIGLSAGPLRKGEFYVFALDFNGKMLAHPVNRKLVGKSVWNIQDSNKKYFVQDFCKLAQQQGSGWVDYTWMRYGEKNPTPKRTYVMRVPGEEVVVCSGYYMDEK